MAITQETVQKAAELIHQIQEEIFFTKLAALGVQPTKLEEAQILWQYGDEVLRKSPRLSDAGMKLKQASMETFGEKVSPTTGEGYTLEALKTAEFLLIHYPALGEAVQVKLAAANAVKEAT
jgi:hypothetical protein